jgi:Zn-dependent protease with chaperone function
MDFFASQERAEKQTRLMLGLFLLAVVCIVVALNLVGGLIFVFARNPYAPSIVQGLQAVPHKAYWITTAVVLGVIAFGSINRMSALSGGGAAVAEMMGARRVERQGGDVAEQRLLNVVEEMAIASGIRMPLVYVMDDQKAINAFAAGYSPNEAAVTVTRGTLERLNRDELQGVVAHEFSHILNGDMRLNIRLMGVVAGIVAIGAIGSFLMRTCWNSDDSSSRRRSDFRLFALGLAIWIIGSIGVFFGTLIKAAISRQREFLADASAVQFTRNPDGIGGALCRIARHGSGVHQRYADELSHMYFSAGMDDFFATHPPIDERVTRILGPAASVPQRPTRPARNPPCHRH